MTKCFVRKKHNDSIWIRSGYNCYHAQKFVILTKIQKLNTTKWKHTRQSKQGENEFEKDENCASTEIIDLEHTHSFGDKIKRKKQMEENIF